MHVRRLLALVLAALPALAWAQQVTLEPSAAAACLRHLQPGSAPEYPFAAFKQKQAGQVRVELSFAGPDSEPDVKLLDSSAAEADKRMFVDAVKSHVRGLRLPCMRAGDAPVRLVQAYSFEPDRRAGIWYETVDPLDEQRRRQLACIVHTSNKKNPVYPWRALRDNIQGHVVARLHFDAPDQPPRFELFSRPNARPLRNEIETWVQGYRMPCHEDGSHSSLWSFAFKIEGTAFGFKPLTLPELMGSVRGIRQQTLRFDTTRMNCPFDLRLDYLQPFLRNAVVEVAAEGQRAPDPSRRELLQWLRGVELALSDPSLDAIFGDTALVTVPCVKIDLEPKE